MYYQGSVDQQDSGVLKRGMDNVKRAYFLCEKCGNGSEVAKPVMPCKQFCLVCQIVTRWGTVGKEDAPLRYRGKKSGITAEPIDTGGKFPGFDNGALFV